ncbi:MAG TPA: DUF503 domain-containing protein [Anaerolineales bacterium]
MTLGIITLHLQIPGCTSLKEKRRRLKPLLARLHRQFNISVAEMDQHDAWQESLIACAVVSNDIGFTTRSLQAIPDWVEVHWPDVVVLDNQIEVF